MVEGEEEGEVPDKADLPACSMSVLIRSELIDGPIHTRHVRQGEEEEEGVEPLDGQFFLYTVTPARDTQRPGLDSRCLQPAGM